MALEPPILRPPADPALADRVRHEFGRELATRPLLIRCRIGGNDLPGAAAEAGALAQAAAGFGAPALEAAARALQRALRPLAAGGAPRLCQALKDLDAAAAATLRALLAEPAIEAQSAA